MGLIDDALATTAGQVEPGAVAAQLGLPEGHVAAIMAALGEDDPVARAAEQTGLDPATVRDVIARLGVPPSARTVGDLLSGGGNEEGRG